MGLNKMLKVGIENEQEQLVKTVDTAAEKTEATTERVDALSENKKNDSVKGKGGRPTNSSRGIKSRKQYTLTLKEDDYSKIMKLAIEEGVSFAKFMERAAKEYIANHNN